MTGFLLALLLWMLGRGPAPAPTPAPHGVTVSPAAPAPAGGGLSRPTAPARGGATRTEAPTVAAPAPAGCHDAADCWPGMPPAPRPVPGGDCPPHPQMSDDPANAACPTDPGGP